MGNVAEALLDSVKSGNPYDYDFEEVKEQQIEAVNERFQEYRGKIKLLSHRASQAGLDRVSSREDAASLLFPHTVYKSYPESFLLDKRWAKLSKWLSTVSSQTIPDLNYEEIKDIDDWVEKLSENGIYVSCSSGTSGKSAMLCASQQDMDWCLVEPVTAYAWGSGVALANDRRIFGLAPVASVPRNHYTGLAYKNMLQDPNSEPFAYPAPPITVGGLTEMVVLRKKIADGTATPSDLETFEDVSKARAKAMDDAVGIAADAIIEAREQKLHISGMWGALYNVAKLVREKGFSAKDFNPENSFYCGGGLKRAQLPDDYREFVYETFNILPERNYQNYSMQEMHTGMPRCQKGGRYHLPPWLVPLVLDKSGDNLLPIANGEYEGRAAFFDLSIDGRWGGVISGDKISIDFSPCACGARGPSIADNIARYADLEGDDKIGCAGTVDAYVRGVS